MEPHVKHLIKALRTMRRLQRQYFATRSTEVLKWAKRAEADVDKQLSRYSEDGEDLGEQTTLF